PQPAAPEQTQPAQTELARVEPTAPPPASATPPGGPSLATPGIRGGFLAPIDGPVIAGFGSQEDGRRNDGVNVAAPRGAPVRAAADGEVVYAGDALQGYGNLILVRHGDGWVTAYAHLDSILAKRGETVKRGQTIGSVGSSGGVGAPQLHFEMRQNNKAVDPIGRLAPT
ncbi:MAG: M23 family metallopeptidase, partial [Alphaproteobacteria bacterium]